MTTRDDEVSFFFISLFDFFFGLALLSLIKFESLIVIVAELLIDPPFVLVIFTLSNVALELLEFDSLLNLLEISDATNFKHQFIKFI